MMRLVNYNVSKHVTLFLCLLSVYLGIGLFQSWLFKGTAPRAQVGVLPQDKIYIYSVSPLGYCVLVTHDQHLSTYTYLQL